MEWSKKLTAFPRCLGLATGGEFGEFNNEIGLWPFTGGRNQLSKRELLPVVGKDLKRVPMVIVPGQRETRGTRTIFEWQVFSEASDAFQAGGCASVK